MKQLSAPGRGASPLPGPGRQLDWTNIVFLVVAHAAAAAGVVWAVAFFNPWTLALAAIWMVLCSMSITAGYHRLLAHRAYEAAPWVRIVALLFGAASVQNSALRWVNEHRLHHAHIDRDGDPYNIQDGFLWAHIGWVLYKNSGKPDLKLVRDLQRDPFIVWQDRYYVPLAIAWGAVLPMGLAALWGDAVGGLLIVGFSRLVWQYHATFATNSVAHSLGSKPYDLSTSARDSTFTALFTFGEGYHNFHHRFPNDYRNGVQSWHFDPTKWLIYSLSRVGAARNLRRTAKDRVARARLLTSGQSAPAPSHTSSLVAPLGGETEPV